MTANGFTISRGDLHAVCTDIYKEKVPGATHSTTVVLKDPLVINRKDATVPIPVYKNTFGIPPKIITQVLTGTGPSANPN